MQRILQEIMKIIILGTPDAWLMRQSSHRSSDPAYYIEDCRILDPHLRYLNLPLLFSKNHFLKNIQLKKQNIIIDKYIINFGFNNFISKGSKNVTKHWEL